MNKQLFNGLLLAAMASSLMFAANFAYESNAKLAVIDDKLTSGLAALKECRSLTDLNTLGNAVLTQRVTALEEKTRRGSL